MITESQLCRFESPTDAKAQLIATATSAQYKLDIVSDHLALYFDDAMAQAISHFVRRHRSLHARILIKDSRPLRGISHPIVALAQRLPSKVHLRSVTEDALPLKLSYCLADESLVVFDSEIDSIGFSAVDRARVAQYRERFEHLWQNQSYRDAELDRLHL